MNIYFIAIDSHFIKSIAAVIDTIAENIWINANVVSLASFLILLTNASLCSCRWSAVLEIDIIDSYDAGLSRSEAFNFYNERSSLFIYANSCVLPLRALISS
jgi:hypothetical protein